MSNGWPTITPAQPVNKKNIFIIVFETRFRKSEEIHNYLKNIESVHIARNFLSNLCKTISKTLLII